MAKKYLKDMVCFFGGKDGKLSFSAENDLLAVSEDDDLSPMNIHKGALSRYSLTLKDTSGETAVIAKANIAAKNELPLFLKNADAAWALKASYKRDLALVSAFGGQAAGGSQPAGQTGPAFTETLTMGEFKGMTPASVVSRPDAVSKLLGQKEILEKNLASYPKNADKIKAIDQAVALFNQGKLDGVPASDGNVALPSSFEVFKTDFKTKREKDPEDENRRLVYGVNVMCDFTKDRFPWSIEITNAYAPVNQEGGRLKPVMSQAVKKVSLKINLGDADFATLLREFDQQERDFRVRVYKPLEDLKNRLVEAVRRALYNDEP